MPFHSLLKTISILLVAACVAISVPAMAIDSGSQSNDPAASINDARDHIRSGSWKSAIDVLKEIIAEDPNDADALNLMGYALRKSGSTDRALGFYLKALKINPNHRAAHEYLGELYVETGQAAKARDMLEALERICGNRTCEEYEDLAEALGI